MSSISLTANMLDDDSFGEGKNWNDLTKSFFDHVTKKTRVVKAPGLKRPSNFIMITSKISRKINITEIRLKELEKICSRSLLFNSEDDKINQLTKVIQENITEIQSSLSTLQKADMMYSSHAEKMAIVAIEIMQTRLISITGDFRKFLGTRTKAIQSKEQKKQNLMSKGSFPINKGKGSSSSGALFLTQRKNNSVRRDEESDQMMGDDMEDFKLVNETEDTQEYQSRLDSMKNIEKMLVDVGRLFEKIGSMIKLHEVYINRIDSNTDDTISNVNKARKELSNHYKDIVSNREFILKIFLILIIFSFIYIVFLM